VVSLQLIRALLLFGGLACLLPRAAQAHHSSAQFDFGHVQYLQGVVQAIRVTNPHMSLTLRVTDAHGSHLVSFEGHSVSDFYRIGWRANLIKVGDHVQISFAPRKDGAAGGFINGFATASGHTMGFPVPRADSRRLR